MSKITILFAIVLFPFIAMADSLESRVEKLEERVGKLETSIPPCFNGAADGMAPRSTNPLILKDGKWAYGSIVYGSTVEFKIIKRFKSETGMDLLAVKLDTPSFSHPCEGGVLVAKDVVIY